MAGRGYLQPSDTVNVAGIGIGARGASNLRGLCDPDEAIVTPPRTSTGQPLSEEELAARAARQQQQAQQAAQRAADQCGHPAPVHGGRRIHLPDHYRQRGRGPSHGEKPT